MNGNTESECRLHNFWQAFKQRTKFNILFVNYSIVLYKYRPTIAYKITKLFNFYTCTSIMLGYARKTVVGLNDR